MMNINSFRLFMLSLLTALAVSPGLVPSAQQSSSEPRRKVTSRERAIAYPDGATCQVHHRPFENGEAEIGYGPPPLPEASEYSDAKRRLFPHANTEVSGGCVVDENSPTHIEAMYCPGCREAKRRWSEEQ